MKRHTEIIYGISENLNEQFRNMLLEKISSNSNTAVAEVGGGANPMFDIGEIRKAKCKYTLIDISENELRKAPDCYEKLVLDVSDNSNVITDSYDLVFSRMLAEHISNAKQFHYNVYQMLRPGGTAVHYFPTLYAFPFLINLLTPEWLSNALLSRFAPRDEYQNAKFPAYYRWCMGPSVGQIRRFELLGYDVLQYYGFFGHYGYYTKIPLVYKIHSYLVSKLIRRPIPFLTSFAFVVLKKPAN